MCVYEYAYMRISIRVYAYWADANYAYILVRIYLSCTVHMYVGVTPMKSNEQRGIGIENEPKRSNGTVNFDRTGPTEKSGPP